MTFLYITNHRNGTFYAIKSLNIGKKEEWLARDTDVCCVLLVSTVENADLQLNVVANDEHVKGAMFCKQGTSEAGTSFCPESESQSELLAEPGFDRAQSTRFTEKL